MLTALKQYIIIVVERLIMNENSKTIFFLSLMNIYFENQVTLFIGNKYRYKKKTFAQSIVQKYFFNLFFSE